MKGIEFIRRVKKIGKKNNITVEFNARRGKGSHGTLYYGSKHTIVRNLKDDLKKGTFSKMLTQIGLTHDDISGGNDE